MSNLFAGINSRLRGASNRPWGGDQSPTTPNSTSDGATKSRRVFPAALAPVSSTPQMPPLTIAPSLSQSMEFEATGEPSSILDFPRPIPAWLDAAYAKHIVKGNLMTLSSKPKTVEQGEWIAHQVVEHYRLLWNFVPLIIETNDDGRAICTCPKMSAGKNHSYTWINSSSEPNELPAHDYITLVGQWISSRIDNPELFPTDPSTASYDHNPDLASHNPTLASLVLPRSSDDWIGKRSGFPEEFASTCRAIFLQMFRVYSHLYWEHFVEPFYHLNLEKQLNSCFSHFILTATTLNILKPHDLAPMQHLIDLWAANNTFPLDSKPYQTANLKRGLQLLRYDISLQSN